MPTKGTKYYWEHREHCQENSRRYAEAHREKQKAYAREYYQKVLKQRRRIDRMYAAAETYKPAKSPKPASNITTVKRFLAKEPVAKNPRKPRASKKHPDLSTLTDLHVPAPSNGVAIIKTEVVIDWNNL